MDTFPAFLKIAKQCAAIYLEDEALRNFVPDLLTNF